MKRQDFDFELPEELIAQTPLKQRDASRLLVYDRKEGAITHRVFSDITEYLSEKDVMVVNETKVIPARLFGTREGLKNPAEFLLLKRVSVTDWHVIMRPGKRLKPGMTVVFSDALSAEILEKLEDGVARVRFEFSGVFEAILDELGQMPLPPYIKEKLADKTRYNTVYAKEDGSAAAPTAGLHFTPELLNRIKALGVKVAPVVLHVGLGTFRPVKEENILDHMMHEESYHISQKSAEMINTARENGGRVIAVGTTSVRVLESVSDADGKVRAAAGTTDIFIYPGYRFKAVDALVTNFHLPESTLLMLVSAFMGKENALAAYKTAVAEKYRFFSFGDAMLII